MVDRLAEGWRNRLNHAVQKRPAGVYPNGTAAGEASSLFHKVCSLVLAHVSARVLDMNGTHRAPGQRVAYLRVSSAGQNLARQLEAVGECDQVKSLEVV